MTIDTSKGSYLYYSVRGVDERTKEEFIINVQKEFECVGGSRIDFGDKILSITFDIEYFGGTEPISVRFDDSSLFVNMPNSLFDINNKRPLFISVNREVTYLTSVSKIMETFGITNRWLAEYILASINYSCPGTQREKCAELSEKGAD